MTDRPLRWCVFDTETSGLIDPVLYVLTIWDSETNWTYNFTLENVLMGVAMLETADVVVSWNGMSYDRDVLTHAISRNLVLPHQLDLYRWLTKDRPAFEKGWKLEDVSLRLFNEAKGEPSSVIPGLWARGEQLTVLAHCTRDVYLTRSVLEHLRDRGWMLDPYGAVLDLEVPEWWQRLVVPACGAPSAPGCSV